MKHFVLLLTALASYSVFAQEVRITKVEMTDQFDMVIYYDLVDEQVDRRYTLRLYVSLDDFIQPVENVEGDIGINIPVGGNKRVVWHAGEDLEQGFRGTVAVELKGQVYIPFINPSGFQDYEVFKRGVPYEITWAGGRGDNVLNFDLYRGEEKVWTQPDVANTGNLTLVIPTNVKPGKKYRFRISDANNPDEVVYTVVFQVKRKVPQVVRIAGVTIIAAVAGKLIYDQFTKDETIPGPPGLPER